MPELRTITTSDTEYKPLLDFRNRLLRVPIGLNLFEEDLSDDERDIIIIATDGGELQGCVMLHPLSEDKVKLRQMAVEESLQGKGIGRLLVRSAERAANDAGYRRIVLHARDTAKGFYEKLGYTQTEGTFTEVGIPHIAMEKTLP